MSETVINSNAFREQAWETFPCTKCGREILLHFNGGEMDRVICCGVEYKGRAKGYEIIASDRGLYDAPEQTASKKLATLATSTIPAGSLGPDDPIRVTWTISKNGNDNE